MKTCMSQQFDIFVTACTGTVAFLCNFFFYKEQLGLACLPFSYKAAVCDGIVISSFMPMIRVCGRRAFLVMQNILFLILTISIILGLYIYIDK